MGQEWHPVDAEVARQEDLTWVARFLIGHYHFGSWAPQRVLDSYQPCPLCSEEFTRGHLVMECGPLESMRRGIFSGILDWERVDLIRLARFHSGPLGRFLRGASEIVVEEAELRLWLEWYFV